MLQTQEERTQGADTYLELHSKTAISYYDDLLALEDTGTPQEQHSDIAYVCQAMQFASLPRAPRPW